MRRITVSCLALALILLGLVHLAAAQNVSIQLTPQGVPIQIPATGGSFNYNIAGTNNGTSPQQAAVWCMVTLPNGNPYGPVLGPVTVTIGAGQTLSRLRSQNVPAGAPEGNYAFNAYIGVYPDTVWDSDTFPFEKLSAQPGGTELWVARYDGSANDNVFSLAVDVSGNVYATGCDFPGGTGYDYATVKYNSEGVEQWVARYNGPGNDHDKAKSIAVDSFGNVYVTGYSKGSGTLNDYATIKYNSAGVQQWVARYNGPANHDDGASAIAVDGAGCVYVTGSMGGGGTYEDYATIKYDSMGIQQWVAYYGGLLHQWNWAYDIAVDGAGNVYVTGYGHQGVTGYDYGTVKYNAAGVEQWAASYNGPGNDSDEAYSIAVDRSGNVYVTGYSEGSGTSHDCATIKYNSAGMEQWVARYNGAGNTWDVAQCLALDGDGNVYVTGFSAASEQHEDYITIKYNSAGAEQWVALYNGPADHQDVAYSIAADSAGNAHVTGYSQRQVGSVFAYDYATIKYNSAGEQQWVARYEGVADGGGMAKSIAVNGGYVYVTGTSDDGGRGADYCTIKYSGGEIANWMPVEATILGQPLPQEFALHQNYPNPFNASTVLSYQLPVASHVKLEIFDVAGRLVGAHSSAPSPLVDGWRSAGVHELTFDASDLPSGMYVAKLEAGAYIGVQKMVLLK